MTEQHITLGEPLTVLGQPAMRLRAPDGAEATVLLHGGHIVSWIPAGDQERLYLSPLTDNHFCGGTGNGVSLFGIKRLGINGTSDGVGLPIISVSNPN